MIAIRKPIYLFAMFAFASMLFAADAADPFVGTWKLNPALSETSAYSKTTDRDPVRQKSPLPESKISAAIPGKHNLRTRATPA